MNVFQKLSDELLSLATGRVRAMSTGVEHSGPAASINCPAVMSSQASDRGSHAIPWPSRAIVSSAAASRDVITVAGRKRSPFCIQSALMFVFKSFWHDSLLSSLTTKFCNYRLVYEVGDRALDDGWHTLIRGLDTAFPYVRLGLPRSFGRA